MSMSRPLRAATTTRVDQRREALLDRLVDLVLAEGFADASVEDLARRLRCSKSTLYGIADSKEKIVVAAVRRFFRRAAARVEARLLIEQGSAAERIRAYLTAIAAELAPASSAFFADLDAWEATTEIYRDNTAIAASRVQRLVDEASPAAAQPQAAFVGAVAAQVMEAIHRGDIESATGLADSDAYRSLADLIVRALPQTSEPAAAGIRGLDPRDPLPPHDPNTGGTP